MKTQPYMSVDDFVKAAEMGIDALIEHDQQEAGIIPVGKHIGYFILMDENGNPIKSEDIPQPYKDLRDVQITPVKMNPTLEDFQKRSRLFRGNTHQHEFQNTLIAAGSYDRIK